MHGYFQRLSEQLWLISKHIITTQNPDFEYRNLTNFHRYQTRDKRSEELKARLDKLVPINFFVDLKNIDVGKNSYNALNEKLANISKYLNFYLHIFNNELPFMPVFETNIDTEKGNYKSYETSIPSKINGKTINETLLELYNYALSSRSNKIMSYLYYYQMLEYMSDYNVPKTIKDRIERQLSKPDIYRNKSEISKEIVDIVLTNTRDNKKDGAKIESLIKEYCDMKELWKEVNLNKEIFSNKSEFYGGLCIEQGEFISENETENEFISGNHKCLQGMLSKIRNAIVHFKESKKNETIIICAKNNIEITPWVNLIRKTVESIMINLEI